MNLARPAIRTFLFMLFASVFLAPAPIWAAEESAEQQLCTASVDKQWAKSIKTGTKLVGGCLKGIAKSKTSAGACLGSDTKGKVAKVRDKLLATDVDRCRDTNRTNFGYAGAAATFGASERVDEALVVALFGDDPASALPIGAPDAVLSKCQQAVTKTLTKCVDAQAKIYKACKKKALKTGAADAAAIAPCFTDDPKGKVAKSCDLDDAGKIDKLRSTIAKKCVDVSLAVAFPQCATGDATALHACLVAPARCAICQATIEAAGLGAEIDCDLYDNAGADGSCSVVFPEHVSISNSVEPAETPGSPAVVVTNPALITQFDGSSFSLNNSAYTRWRASGPEVAPDAVVIAVPGFGGGANNFKVMAEDLIAKSAAMHGQRIEFWGFHRRTEQLEDREGALVASDQADADLAMDWYYGDDLGVDLDSRLDRRAEFYNTSDDIPFIANFTTQVFSRDLDVVVAAASAVAGGNVFLGGHSAGTGFVARYASTDFNLTGIGSPDPGYAKLRGLLLFEGGGGTTSNESLSADSIARIEDKFDGGLFAAVRDGAPRCVDGTPCTIETEAADCVGKGNARCTESTTAYSAVGGLGPEVVAASEPNAIQALTDPDSGVAIVQRDTAGPGTAAIDLVPGLSLLGFLAPSTAEALFGQFLDDDEVGADLSAALGTGLGKLGGGTPLHWLDITEALPASATPDNGPMPTTLPAGRWGVEKELSSMARFRTTFLAAGTNAADWYYASSGLSTTSAPGRCEALVCTVGDVGAACSTDGGCAQSVSLDSSDLSIGADRRDIVNLTQASAVDIPVICIGGSNGLTPVGASYLSVAGSFGTCAAASCNGTVRVVDDSLPSQAFPTFGGVDGGFEVYIREGLAHNDVLTVEDGPDSEILGPVAAFIARNSE